MRTAFVALCVLAAGAVSAQSAEPLPAKLSGRWTFMGPAGVFNDVVSLAFDAGAPPGRVAGRATWRGLTCGAQDEPFTGTWDGTELRIDTTHRPNVNAQRMNGSCAQGHAIYVLKRVPGTDRFEGNARVEGLPAVASVTLAP